MYLSVDMYVPLYTGNKGTKRNDNIRAEMHIFSVNDMIDEKKQMLMENVPPETSKASCILQTSWHNI